MYLPPFDPADLFLAASGDGGNDSTSPGGPSSLIGIVTAICGNVLISFALNTQRYAHLRLGRAREEREEKQKRASRPKQRGEGESDATYQVEVAEQRARENAKDGGDEAAGEYSLDRSNETTPLIPRLERKKTSTSTDDDPRPSSSPEEKGVKSAKEKSYLRSPIWWLGIGLMTVGEAGNFLAYGFAPASIVSPLGVVALISNCLIAPLLLGERFRWRDGIGVVIAVAGCVTVVLSASDSNPKLTPDSIWHLITRWEFETYLGVTSAVIIALVMASNKFGHRSILIDLGLVGLFGGYTALSTKGIASLLSNTIWRVVTFPITYLLVAVLVFTAVMQIKYLNRALQHFNATMVIPTQFVLFTLSVIIGSAILYGDFERESAEDAGKFVGGCALTFLGVWCITSGRKDDPGGDEETGYEQNAIDLEDEEGIQPEISERSDGTERRRSLIAGSSKIAPKLSRDHNGDAKPPSFLLTPEVEPLSDTGQPTHLNLAEPSTHDILTPANSAAIHDHALPIVTQSQSSLDRPNPFPMHATTSAPIIPTLQADYSARPGTPLNRNISGPAVQDPSTPQHQHPQASTGRNKATQTAHHLDPNASTKNLLNRGHSLSGGLIPGLLTSPLSSSLSAIVADSLRRGVDSPSHSTFRRRQSSKSGAAAASGATPPSRRLSFRPAVDHRASDDRADPMLGHSDNEDYEQLARPQAGTGSPRSRVRKLSTALGNLFGSSPGKRPRVRSPGAAEDARQTG